MLQQSLLNKIKQYLIRNRYSRNFCKFVQFLCCIVVFVTTYALILPAITMEQETFCGKEEHTHSELCQQPSQMKNLICTPEKLEIHVHFEDCYDEEGTLTCGQADYIVHAHDASCYDAFGQLVCILPERSAHIHGEDCYAPAETLPEVLHVHAETCNIQEKGELICLEEEREAHFHKELCYEAGDVLECLLTENHVHDASCYSPSLGCTLSTEPHVHQDDCYEAGDLCCGILEGHVHTDDCKQEELTCLRSEGGHQHTNGCWETVQICENVDETHTHGDDCVRTDLVCGLTEEQHYHDGSCYSVSIHCDIPENHMHGQGCYEAVKVCGKEAGETHEHATECYGGAPQLQCQQPENHTHGSACFNQILICELPEDPGHIHEDPCYLWNSVLNCGLEEGQPEPTEPAEPVLVCMEPEAPVHVHDESCFEPVADNRVLVCEVEEEGHEHTDLCYGCPLEEHVHTLICYSDPEADVETSDIWEATFAHVSLSGHGPTDLVAIAESQLGYTESIRNYEVWEDNSIHGYTRYGDWYGSPYGDWCAMFVSFCLNYADVDGVPQHWGVRPWISELSARGLYYNAKETKPQKGNLIFFDWERDGLADHVGIVADVQEAQEHTGASVKAIEGNSSDCVRYVYYSPDDPVILGYGLLPGQERIPVAKEPIAEEETPATYYCGLEEHTHSEDCYDEEGNLLCQLTEHSHTETCLEEPVIYGCGMEEHIHEGTCYNPAGELICGIDEHTHEDACRVNTTEVFIESSSESVVITYSAVHIEEVSPESAVVFRMYAASPMTVSEEDVSARTTAMDLNTYIAQYPNSTIRLKLLTMGNTVPEDNKIEIGKQYQLSLYFAVPGHGMEAGTYIYKLPEAFNYTVQTGKLYDSSKNVLLGEWTLYENGDLVFVFNEASNGYQDVAMTATIKTTVKEEVKEVDFDGTVYVVIEPTDEQEIETQIIKYGEGMVQDGDNWIKSETDYTRIKWTVLFTPGSNGLTPGSPVKDILTSEHHYFSDMDMAAGITIGFQDAGKDWHQITVPPDSITWNNNIGFEFNLPDISCQFCNNKFEFLPERQYYLTYYTTVDENLTDDYYLHENDIYLDNKIEPGSIGLQIGTAQAHIVKNGRFDLATQNVKWTIQAKMSAYTGGQANYLAIWDVGQILDENWNKMQKIPISSNNFERVTAEVNGKTITVPHINAATESDEFWYSFKPGTNNDAIIFGHKCYCEPNKCAFWREGHEYCDYWAMIDTDAQPESTRGKFCSCWTYPQDVTFTFHLVYDIVNIVDTYGGYRFYNGATLEGYHVPVDGEYKTAFSPSSSAEVNIPGMFNKEVVLGPNYNNNFTASFRITVNDSKLDLSQLGGVGTSTDITIVDTMSPSLYYVRGTMVITRDDKTVLHYGKDYDMTVNGHTIKIDIHDPGPYQYILEYDAQLIVDTSSGQDPKYKNDAEVYIGAKIYHASTQESHVTEYSYTADRYSVTMLKTSAESGQPLPGAVFGLFAESGLEIARGTTDTNGNISFETDLLENIVFRLHMPYYLQEISAPEGYILDDSKHWFYFSNHENTNGNKDPCAECTKLNNTYEDIIEIEKTNIDHDRIVDITVTNSMWGYELPATGGVGREVYAVGGWLLILAAGILLYNQKKCRKEDYQSS